MSRSIPCQKCGGEGEKVNYRVKIHETQRIAIPCAACDATGKVEIPDDTAPAYASSDAEAPVASHDERRCTGLPRCRCQCPACYQPAVRRAAARCICRRCSLNDTPPLVLVSRGLVARGYGAAPSLAFSTAVSHATGVGGAVGIDWSDPGEGYCKPCGRLEPLVATPPVQLDKGPAGYPKVLAGHQRHRPSAFGTMNPCEGSGYPPWPLPTVLPAEEPIPAGPSDEELMSSWLGAQ